MPVSGSRCSALALVVERQGEMPADLEVRLPVGLAGVVGRNPDAVVVLRDHGVSPAHAELMVNADGTWIADLFSSAGTYVNDAPVVEWTRLGAGDVIDFGPIRASIRTVSEDGRSPILLLYSLIVVLGLVFLSFGISISS